MLLMKSKRERIRILEEKNEILIRDIEKLISSIKVNLDNKIRLLYSPI